MDEIENEYIENALDELTLALGTKEFVDQQKLIALVCSKKVKECIKEIALSLGLPIEVNVSYVPKGYRPNANDGFQSVHLVKKAEGSAGITAQVSIPANLPFYGTVSMVNFPINVRLSEDCAENPATLISVMAHELSHVVLYSIRHKEKENEFYTDLTAMMLGFADIMKNGRQVIKTSTRLSDLSGGITTYTETTTYGYLSDENFYFAFGKIKDIFYNQESERKALLKKIMQLKRQSDKTKKLVLCFKSYLEHLDKNHTKKIPQEDGHKISAFHQSGYIDNFQQAAKIAEGCAESFLEFMKNLKNYTRVNIEKIQQHTAQLKSTKEILSRQHFLLQKDVIVLKKYVSFLYKLKFALQSKSKTGRRPAGTG